jgi:FixJ family two-component response regulator
MRAIMATTHRATEPAVAAMKRGAVDFIQEPFTPAEIREGISSFPFRAR